MPQLGKLLTTEDWRGRSAVLACLIVFPFMGFVLRRQYPFFSPETMVGLLVLSTISVLAGLLCRGAVFRLVVLTVCCVCALVPLQRELSHWVHVDVVVLAWVLVSLLGLMMWRLKGRFYLAVAVFSTTLLAANLFRIGAPAHILPAAETVNGERPPAHFLYLVLDEHMGPEGLPADIEECRQARGKIERTARRWGLTLHSNAYSNYATTFDSLTSAMNGRLLARHLELSPPPDARGVHHLDTQAFRAAATSQGYALRFIQLRNIDFTGSHPELAFNYDDSIAEAGDMPGGWTDRFKLLVGRYQASDLVFARFKGFFPFRFGLRMLFPLSAGRQWPAWLIEEILAAKRPTLFFAHILCPHGPYLYKADGTLRAPREWTHDQDYQRLERPDYRARYARYGEQVQFLQTQLSYLFSELNARGLFDQMTVVIHGDHGSRILQQRPGIAKLEVSGPLSVDRFDYAGKPDPQELRDRFSVLFAAKRSGQKIGYTQVTPISLVRVIPTYTGVAPLPDERSASAAYLFDGEGKPVEIPISDLWRP